MLAAHAKCTRWRWSCARFSSCARVAEIAFDAHITEDANAESSRVSSPNDHGETRRSKNLPPRFRASSLRTSLRSLRFGAPGRIAREARDSHILRVGRQRAGVARSVKRARSRLPRVE